MSKQDKLASELKLVDEKMQSTFAFESFVDSLKAKNNGKLLREKMDDPTIAKLEKMKEKALTDLFSIPDSFATKMQEFAVSFPQNPKSEQYLYRATQLSEKAGRFFETAKWLEMYLKTFPNGKFKFEALLSAAANFEKCGTIDKAIVFYERCAKELPDKELARQSGFSAEMLRKGLITPEQQLDYLLQQKDSTKH